MRKQIEAFLRDYVRHYNLALSGNPNYDAIIDCFTPCFIGAGPTGVECGRTGDEFRKTLEQAFAFYRQIGAKSMDISRVTTTEIDNGHAMAKVDYRAEYAKPNGGQVAIEFSVAYLLQMITSDIKIFAFIAGDEMDAYKQAGLIS